MAALVSSKVFDDFPDLKIIVSHGGGAIPYQRGRFEPQAIRQGTTYREMLRKLYYDTCLYTQDSIELLLKAVGVDRCMFGSEKPGVGSTQDPATGRWIDDIHLLIDDIEWLDDDERDQLFETTARELFRICRRTSHGTDRARHRHLPRSAAGYAARTSGASARRSTAPTRPSSSAARSTPSRSSSELRGLGLRRRVRARSSGPKRHAASRAAIEELGRFVKQAELDVLVIVSSDHKETFSDELLPQFAVYWGDTVQHVPLTQAHLDAMPPGPGDRRGRQLPRRARRPGSATASWRST